MTQLLVIGFSKAILRKGLSKNKYFITTTAINDNNNNSLTMKMTLTIITIMIGKW